MSLILKQVFSFLKLLNSDTGNISLAMGITCGFMLGMTPSLSLHSLFIFLFMFFFRVQLGAAFVTIFFVKFIAFLFDPLFHQIGIYVLKLPELRDYFTVLYNLPLIPYTRFNNSIVMGSAVVTLILSPFIFIISQILIVRYRQVFLLRFKETKFWKFVTATKFYKWYYTYSQYNWKKS